MLIEVTQEDIDHGIRNDCTECPVALAIKRASGNWFGVIVLVLNGICVRGRTYRTPRQVAQFIQAYDRGESVGPITFTLED